MKKEMKKLVAGLLISMLCFTMTSCSFIFGTRGDQGKGQTEEKPASTFVAIDINPSIELTVSEDGTVVSVYGANEDGQILLYEEEVNIVNKDIEAAVAYITELAKKLGYLNEDNSDVSTTVSAKTEAVAEALKSKIDAKIVASAEEMGLAVSINAETAFALLCELEELKNLYPDNTAIQNLTPNKYKLAISASNGGDITIEAAASMSNEALISEINKAHKTLEAYATDAYLEAKARAIAMFESSMGVISDGVYTKIYAERAASILANPSYINTIHYGAMYQAYKTSARTYLAVLEIMKFADEYTSYELDEASVADIKAALSIADDSQLRDENGKITLGSVSDFCNKFIDENDVSEDVKTSVKEILAEAKDAAELVVMASGAYEIELATLKSAIQTVISNVTTVSSTILPVLPADAKAEFEACLEDLRATSEKIADIMENGDTSDAVILLAEQAQKKADEVLEKIENNLTDAEKAKAEAILTAVESQVKTLTSEFEGRLSVAEAQAKQYIENKRQQRLNEE